MANEKAAYLSCDEIEAVLDRFDLFTDRVLDYTQEVMIYEKPTKEDKQGKFILNGDFTKLELLAILTVYGIEADCPKDNSLKIVIPLDLEANTIKQLLTK